MAGSPQNTAMQGAPLGGSQSAMPSMSPPTQSGMQGMASQGMPLGGAPLGGAPQMPFTQSGALTAPNMAGNIPYYMGGQFNQQPPTSTPFSGMLQNMASQGMPQQPFGMQGPPPQDAFAQMQQQQGMMGGMPTGPQMPFTQSGAQQMMPPPRPQLDPRQQLRSDVLHDKVQDLKKQYAANPSPELAARIEKVRNKRRDILGREPLVSGAPNSQQVGSEDPRMQAMRKLQTFPARTG